VAETSVLINLASEFRQRSEQPLSGGKTLRANLYAEVGREDWGIWRLIPGNGKTGASTTVTFSRLAARALQELGIGTAPAPQPRDFDPNWHSTEEVPAGLGAVDECSRAWLNHLRKESLSNGDQMFRVHQGGGLFPDVWEASAVQCERSARDLIRAKNREGSKQVRPPQGHRGRFADQERRIAIATAIRKQGKTWRDNIETIFAELDNQEVPMGGFRGMVIDLGDGKSE
jgi:hypothetical protein